jgi:hypothetical protein
VILLLLSSSLGDGRKVIGSLSLELKLKPLLSGRKSTYPVVESESQKQPSPDLLVQGSSGFSLLNLPRLWILV